MRGVFAMRPHPTPKHIHMNIEVSSCLTDRDTPIQYQLYCLNLELPTEPPSRTHAVPPIPKEHLKMVSTEPGTSQTDNDCLSNATSKLNTAAIFKREVQTA
jgi:hypothetical protein